MLVTESLFADFGPATRKLSIQPLARLPGIEVGLQGPV
jgi:hypothetical protein